MIYLVAGVCAALCLICAALVFVVDTHQARSNALIKTLLEEEREERHNLQEQLIAMIDNPKMALTIARTQSERPPEGYPVKYMDDETVAAMEARVPPRPGIDLAIMGTRGDDSDVEN